MNLNLKQLEAIREAWPLCNISVQDGMFIVHRHPSDEKAPIWNKQTLTRVSIRLIKSRENTHKFATSFYARVVTAHENWFSPSCSLTFICKKCCHQWNNNIYQMKTIIERWSRKVSDDLLKYCFCPKCREEKVKTAREKKRWSCRKFKDMTNNELESLVKSLPSKHIINSTSLIKYSTPLYHELLNRKHSIFKNLLTKIWDDLGVKRRRPELHHYTESDWNRYLRERNYYNLQDFRGNDSHAHKILSSKPYKKDLLNEYFPTSLLYNGARLQSYAELAVAIALEFLDIKYIAHPKWDFAYEGGSRNCVADFSFSNFNQEVYIEVWMHNHESASENDKLHKFRKDYLIRRYKKEKLIAKQIEDNCDKQLFLPLEANILRNEGIDAFLEHIKKQLSMLGLPKLKKLSKDIFPDAKMFNLNSYDAQAILEICLERGFKYFTHLPNLYIAYLGKNEEIKSELIELLAKHYSYPASTRNSLSKSSDVIEYVKQNKDLHSKALYQKAHKDGLLPRGFPQCILSAYEEVVSWGQAWGEPLLVSYCEAKEICIRLKVTGKESFSKRRYIAKKKLDPLDKDFELLKVRSNPGNMTSGGYMDDWTSWNDFLDNQTPRQQTEQGMLELKIINRGSSTEVIELLSNLNIVSMTSFRKQLPAAYLRSFKNREDFRLIEIEHFGSTSSLIHDFGMIAKLVTPESLTTFKDWKAARESNIEYKQFPLKLYRYTPGNSEDWSSVLRKLKSHGDLFH
jgi:hypothetical protein